MKVYSINYDLRQPGRNYGPLYDAIKSYGTYYNALESLWIIATAKSAEQVRDHLAKHIDGNDGLLVARLSGEAAWQGLPAQGSTWLKQQLESKQAA